MSKKHTTKAILPFPDNIDRNLFGQHISGLTDGEGCFGLIKGKKKNALHTRRSATFVIKLRADDLEIMQLVQSFFACGHINHYNISASQGKPQAAFLVSKCSDLVKIIIPHFEKHPLYAKKKRDFIIWKQAVLFLRSLQSIRNTAGRSRPGIVRWTKQNIDNFDSIIKSLKDQRLFETINVLETPALQYQEAFSLFDLTEQNQKEVENSA